MKITSVKTAASTGHTMQLWVKIETDAGVTGLGECVHGGYQAIAIIKELEQRLIGKDPFAIDALFEGIRCQTGEVKLYASWDAGQGWTPATRGEWQPLSFRGPTRRAMQMALGGVCSHRTPNGPPARILDTLRNGTPALGR